MCITKQKIAEKSTFLVDFHGVGVRFISIPVMNFPSGVSCQLLASVFDKLLF
jgi:ABC-type polysaccharide/polyol phosphate transport system ATPase subunit